MSSMDLEDVTQQLYWQISGPSQCGQSLCFYSTPHPRTMASCPWRKAEAAQSASYYVFFLESDQASQQLLPYACVYAGLPRILPLTRCQCDRVADCRQAAALCPAQLHLAARSPIHPRGPPERCRRASMTLERAGLLHGGCCCHSLAQMMCRYGSSSYLGGRHGSSAA